MFSIEKFKDYLKDLDIDKDEKNYALNFNKKNDYLNNLRLAMVKEIGKDITMGYGDVNSKILIMFKDRNSFLSVKKSLQSLFALAKFNFWDTYITFINKTDADYPKKYEFIIREIIAVHPDIIYLIGDESDYNKINMVFAENKLTYPAIHSFCISEKQINDENAVKDLWSKFKYLINYKD